MSAEEAQRQHSHSCGLITALKSGCIWLLGLVYLGPVVGICALSFWMPQIIQGLVKFYGIADPLSIGLLTALPSVGAAICIVFWTRHSNQTKERLWHTVVPLVVGAVGLVMSAYLQSPISGLLSLSIAMIGVNVSIPMFWMLPAAALTGTAAAVGIAIINCIENFDGDIGPQLVGFVKGETGNIANALLVIAALMIVAGLIAIPLEKFGNQQEAMEAPAAE
jgi:hypothetical protein